MTLTQFFDLLSANPSIVLFYFGAIISTAILAGIFSKGESYSTPWTYLYSALIYMVCIPGIFAFTLNIYTFIFERRSVYDLNVYVHYLPILAMIGTLMIIRNNIEFKYIPGFDKLSALMFIIAIIMTLLWILDRTQIFIISFMPFQYALLILGGLLLLLRYSFKRLF